MNTTTTPTITDLDRHMGLTDGDTGPAFQLGHRQWQTWVERMSNPQRILANTLMAGGLAASKAMAEARRMVG